MTARRNDGEEEDVNIRLDIHLYTTYFSVQGFFLDLSSKQLLRLVTRSTGGIGTKHVKYQMLGIAKVLLKLGENGLRNDTD